jgi:tetratricopeptide (TPR) repeat protein
MDVRPKLIELLQQTLDEERRFIGQLAPEELHRVGQVDAWSAKDLIAHLAGWKLRMADRLAAIGRGEATAPTEEVDVENASIWAEHSSETWDEVVQASALGHRRIIEGLQALSLDDVHDAQRFESQQGQPLWRGVAGNGCTHPIMHLAEAYVKRGQAAYAAAMMESLSVELVRLDDSPRWLGVVRYNLACYFSLAGETARAIEALRDALRLHPGLLEWSKEDTDLASLRDESDYMALYPA